MLSSAWHFFFKVPSTWNVSKESRKLAGYGGANCNSRSWEVGARAVWIQIHFYTIRFCVRKVKGEGAWEGSARAECTNYCFSEEVKKEAHPVCTSAWFPVLTGPVYTISSKTSSCQWVSPVKASYELQTFSVDKGERALYMKTKQQFISLQMAHRELKYMRNISHSFWLILKRRTQTIFSSFAFTRI